MDSLNKTSFVKKEEYPDEKRDWYQVDASGKYLGRLASRIATVLMGKHKPVYTPNVDVGDHVVVTGVENIRLSGNKLEEESHEHFSGYPGGLYEKPVEEIKEENPEQLIEVAVKGMLPKSKLGRKMLKKLHAYSGEDHPHKAQNPEDIELEDLVP